MNELIEPKKKEQGNVVTIIGLCCVVLTLLISFLPDKAATINSGDFFDEGGPFFIIYAITFFYSVIILIHSFRVNRWKFLRMDRRHFITALMLFSISAFSLNQFIAIFSEFPLWVKIYLGFMHLGVMAIPYVHRIPKPLRYLNFFLLGLATIMSFYFAIYLLRFSHIGIIAAFFFGISLHLFTPLFLLIICITQFAKLKKDLMDTVSYLSGIALPIAFVVMMLISWNQSNKLIHESNAAVITRPENTLPKWVILSQRLPDTWFVDKAIRGDLSYDVPQWSSGFWGVPGNSFSESKVHDPLVYIGFLFFDDFDLTRDERIKILQSKFDARHESQRKLWGGQNLSTSEVLTNIQVFPEYRLAYLEKILHIKHTRTERWGSREQEAAYTFYLPEGSVATSLSLWIDGKEEKSRLTTKEKADSAYVSIVGVERRDPALLHWQEGNTLTVTVFPCTEDEVRKFRIGLTIPLEKRGETLVLKNVYFKGPQIKTSYETTVVKFASKASPGNLVLPSNFEEVANQTYQYTGNYRPYWEITCTAPPLSKEAFSFNGKSFQVSELKGKLRSFDPEFIFLDINKSWTEQEFNAVWKLVRDKTVYVYRDEPLAMTEENKDKFFKWMSTDNFSLFPINSVWEPNNTLVISKSVINSPSLLDLEETLFSERMQKHIEIDKGVINLFSLSTELSPYLKTLNEFQTFNYAKGGINELAALLKEKQFPINNTSDQVVELPISNTVITQDTTAALPSKAPDHLMRLFAYNQIMKKTGKHYFEEDTHVTEELIGIANEAFVVSPISSLIVLETIKDYERFDIKENENSLQNASTASSGAVPEPHEWALILLTVLLLTWVYFKRPIL